MSVSIYGRALVKLLRGSLQRSRPQSTTRMTAFPVVICAAKSTSGLPLFHEVREPHQVPKNQTCNDGAIELAPTPKFSTTPILDSFCLSSDEAFSYLEVTLGIESVGSKLRRDPARLLGEIVRQSHYRVPFQNITNICALPPEERHVPSYDEMVGDMLSRRGGVCYQLNIFTNRLLTTLGYNVMLVGGSFMGSDRYHVTNIVQDLEVKGQRHLVEVGASDPTFVPIPLDFIAESATYRHSFLTYKLMRMPGGLIRRLHAPLKESPDEALMEEDGWQDGWRVISDVDPDTARDVDYFADTMSYVFYALPRPKLKMFNEGMFAMVYNKGKMVYFRDNSFYLELEGESIEQHVTVSAEELLAAYARHMPMIPQCAVVDGIRNMEVKFPLEKDIERVSIIPLSVPNEKQTVGK